MNTCPTCHTPNRDTARFCASCGARLAQASGGGQVLGGEYRVVSIIKSGGMGRVYQAESGGKRYALKEMLDSFTQSRERQEAINRFMAEAMILAKLNHPQIPRVHTFFTEDERYYLVMDFVEGEDLHALLGRQGGPPLPEEQVIQWGIQLCDVLEYLHSQQPPIIFRDLKPGNIMRTPNDQIMLVDFGISRFFRASKSSDTIRIGTIGYAPPEQYGGSLQTDARSDLYALGATLHHLLTGRDPCGELPFQFPAPSSLRPGLSLDSDRALNRALAYHREQRFQSAAEMRQALLGVLQPPIAPLLPPQAPPGLHLTAQEPPPVGRLTLPPPAGHPRVVDNVIYNNLIENNVAC
jgi:serine/threonine protein kinase